MTSYVERTDTATVRLERLLPGPIERVWAFITESDLRRQWLAAGEFELTVGGPELSRKSTQRRSALGQSSKMW